MYCCEALLQHRNNLPNTNVLTFCAMFTSSLSTTAHTHTHTTIGILMVREHTMVSVCVSVCVCVCVCVYMTVWLISGHAHKQTRHDIKLLYGDREWDNGDNNEKEGGNGEKGRRWEEKTEIRRKER